jgi:hypothetical protein
MEMDSDVASEGALRGRAELLNYRLRRAKYYLVVFYAGLDIICDRSAVWGAKARTDARATDSASTFDHVS